LLEIDRELYRIAELSRRLWLESQTISSPLVTIWNLEEALKRPSQPKGISRANVKDGSGSY
jgi:hypothetical protein